MKIASRLSLILILAGALGPASAQVTLTRVLEGDLATDTGYFWSCAWGDYDQDGNVDLFVCNSLGNVVSATNRLYHNNGNGTFTRITTGTLVNERADSSTAVWGDFDNDGDLDLFVSNNLGLNNWLYHNESDGTFSKVTAGAVVNDGAGPSVAPGPTSTTTETSTSSSPTAGLAARRASPVSSTGMMVAPTTGCSCGSSGPSRTGRRSGPRCE